MAYLHCHSCRWEQDDFWSPDGYLPLREDLMDYLRKCLFEEKVETIDYETEHFITISGKEMVARELEKLARVIRNHKWTTWEDWKKVSDTAVCPKCGQRNWDTD